MAAGQFTDTANCINAKAGADLAANRIVKLTNTGTEPQAVYAGAGEGIGITTEAAVTGQTTGIATQGQGVLEVNGSGTAIAAGDPLKATTDGIGIKAGSDKDKVVAIALEPAATSGAKIKVLIVRYDAGV